MRFEWDSAKAAENLEKHGVSFEEAAIVFRDTLSATGEERFVAFGVSASGRLSAVILSTAI